jgi:gas vesicle protein
MSTSDPGGFASTGVRPGTGATGAGVPPTGGSGQSAASDAKEQAQEKAQQVAGQAQEKAQQAAGQGKQRAKTLVDERSTQVGEQVSTQASDIRTVGQKLREEGKDGPAKLADQAADRVERIGGYLTGSNADRILHDLEDLGRKSPLAVIAGGMTLGFAASRFLKASASERYTQRSSGAGRTQPSYTPPALSQRSTGTDGPSMRVEDRPTSATGAGASPLPPATPGTGRGL